MTKYFWNHRISGDRAEHAARGGGAATDYATPMRTPVHAPFAGIVQTGQNSERGKWISITKADQIVYICHLAHVAVKNGQSVAWRQPIGQSGNTGNVSPLPTRANPSAGSHVHTWVEKAGVRYSFKEWLDKFVNVTIPQPAPPAVTPERSIRFVVGRAWYLNATDAKNERNPHGPKWTREKHLLGSYPVTQIASNGAVQVRANDGSYVWVSPRGLPAIR